ncbi:hypothetical protein G3N30_09860 [Microbacterium lacticum]|uniref:hypothetical protein n=1 Tax=Microbacterium lacticum TaxID=33885 RepID=UPI0018B0A176|nr:hypothetical protein [Microbacterium lacticum]MBF9336511.1 hypothetical protein [Microbacterium lacticum]
MTLPATHAPTAAPAALAAPVRKAVATTAGTASGDAEPFARSEATAAAANAWPATMLLVDVGATSAGALCVATAPVVEARVRPSATAAPVAMDVIERFMTCLLRDG